MPSTGIQYFKVLIVTFFPSQSQPCHWRNLKTVTKRDLSNKTIELANESNESAEISTTITSNVIAGEEATTKASTSSEDKKEAALSDNISLFQSLRVLQEGEEGDEHTTAEVKS